MYRILISDKLGQAGLDKLSAVSDATFDVKTGLSKDELCAIMPEYDALIIRSGTRVDADIVAAASKLQVIGRAGIGVDNVDVAAATRRGIIVMNTPHANSIATAEQTMGLMLAASRHTAPAHASLKAGEWNRSGFVGSELYGKTLGIIGFGKIGRLVAERAKAFGMTIIAYDPFVSEEVGLEYDVTLVDMDDLLAGANYITLHSVVTPDTIGMINEAAINQMRDGVILVNVARGKLIDEAALLEGLNSGKIKTAALDVFQQEPPVDNPLIGHPQVLHTPHLGASSVEAQRAVAVEIVDQVLDALRGTNFRNAVNLPFGAGIDFKAIRPYLNLGEKLGTTQANLAQGPIQRVEIELRGQMVADFVRPVAAAILKGILSHTTKQSVNLINAPSLAEAAGIALSQTTGLNLADYPNLISCRVNWAGGQHVVAGVLFAGDKPRIVQIDGYQLDAKPEGTVLLLQNKDVPGVIGQVATILAAYEVNIGEWRMGRHEPGSEALSFINLDSEPPAAALNALAEIKAATLVQAFNL